MNVPNMTMLLGNHEQMCLDTLGPHNEYGARHLWRQNGGMPTCRELLYHRTPHERNMILRFLAGLPDQLDIVVGWQKLHLVHGCSGNANDARIWGRLAVETKRRSAAVWPACGWTIWRRSMWAAQTVRQPRRRWSMMLNFLSGSFPQRSSMTWMPTSRGLQKHVSHLDCLWGELYGSINASQWDHSITEEQADYLRKKYLF